jgi:hypothetical protein
MAKGTFKLINKNNNIGINIYRIMKTKNSIIFNNKKLVYSGSGLFQKGLHQAPSRLFNHIKDNHVVNSPVFGRVLGVKYDNDSTKIGNIHSALPNSSNNHSDISDISNALKQISFKKSKKSNIKLVI